MIHFDRWEIRALPTDIPSLAVIWHKLQEYPTLFSDATRGDIRNWISMIRDESFVWYLVEEHALRALVGIMYFQLIEDKADGHLLFFDRKPAEKKELVRFFCRFLFDALPQLNKITASVPAIYHSTRRLAVKVGFKWEGTLRQDVKIGGKLVDVDLFGLLRHEANYGISQREGQGDQHHAPRYSPIAERDQPAITPGTER